MKKLVITTLAIATMSLSTLAGIPWKLSSDIRDRAAVEWPDDYTMQEYEISRQTDAYMELNNYKNREVPKRVLESIIARAVQRWPDDYVMQLYETKQQAAAWIQINGK